MHGRDIGNLTGAFAGGMVTLAMATGQAVRATAQHRRDLATVNDWSRALQRERDARIESQREQVRLVHEIAMLRLALQECQAELEIHRNR